MSTMPNPIEAHELPDAKGHTIGFIESTVACDGLILALNPAGFSDAQITVLRGESGVSSLEQMLKGSSWGESAAEVLKQGTLELQEGHSVVCVEVHTDEEAATVVAVSRIHGGYSIYHFDDLIDTRLTA